MSLDSDSLKVVEALKELHGARPCDGECSAQVAFRLASGRVLVIGTTDPDVAAHQGLWVREDSTAAENSMCQCGHPRLWHGLYAGNWWFESDYPCAGPLNDPCECREFASEIPREGLTEEAGCGIN